MIFKKFPEYERAQPQSRSAAPLQERHLFRACPRSGRGFPIHVDSSCSSSSRNARERLPMQPRRAMLLRVGRLACRHKLGIEEFIGVFGDLPNKI